MTYSDDINEDINVYLDYYRLAKGKDYWIPPGTNRAAYIETIKLKLQDLLNLKTKKIAKTSGKDVERIIQALRKGVEVEKEHTSDPMETQKIALDHLEKNPDHYTIEENTFNFDNLYDLAMLLDDNTFGLVETIKIEGIDAELSALIDTGNGAYNVLHGTDIKDNGHKVSFKTVDGIVVEKEKIDDITIHVGAGYDEHRPVVEFTVEIADTVYPDVKFSIGDRTENQHPVLIGVDFLKQIGSLIDVNKE